jgi:hypothetical protein
MAPQRAIHLCHDVEVLALSLGLLNARRCEDDAQEVLLRMKLAALTTELRATDLIDRTRRSAALS